MAFATRPLIGREAEIAEVFEVLLRWRHNNALILGRPGVGKTSVVVEVARRMAMGTAPQGLVGRGMVELNMRALIAATASLVDTVLVVAHTLAAGTDTPTQPLGSLALVVVATGSPAHSFDKCPATAAYTAR